MTKKELRFEDGIMFGIIIGGIITSILIMIIFNQPNMTYEDFNEACNALHGMYGGIPGNNSLTYAVGEVCYGQDFHLSYYYVNGEGPK